MKKQKADAEPMIDPTNNWQPPRRTLVVAATPRSGSTLLCQSMAATEMLGKPGEYFKSKHWPEVDRSETVDFAERLPLPAIRGATPNGIASFKLFPKHLDQLCGVANLFHSTLR